MEEFSQVLASSRSCHPRARGGPAGLPWRRSRGEPGRASKPSSIRADPSVSTDHERRAGAGPSGRSSGHPRAEDHHGSNYPPRPDRRRARTRHAGKLMATPVPPLHLILGKFLVVATQGLLTAFSTSPAGARHAPFPADRSNTQSMPGGDSAGSAPLSSCAWCRFSQLFAASWCREQLARTLSRPRATCCR